MLAPGHRLLQLLLTQQEAHVPLGAPGWQPRGPSGSGKSRHGARQRRGRLVFAACNGVRHPSPCDRDRFLELPKLGVAPLLQAWHLSPWAACVPQGMSPEGTLVPPGPQRRGDSAGDREQTRTEERWWVWRQEMEMGKDGGCGGDVLGMGDQGPVPGAKSVGKAAAYLG